ncbi:G-protein coupled receptor moody-like [Limulus polyphemus]|uniref:G-protein coupled receptor moody-like n=1 Tax=Limulus polyphemus TaxID=6850 RepID=A0ABM1TSA6_LIMPO|nr:G-protein coupled receptor moody-like [Limulus polyphemus]
MTTKKLRTPSDMLIFFMSLNDFLFVVCVMPLYVDPILYGRWRFDSGKVGPVCLFNAYGGTFFQMTNLFILGVISFNRYITVVHPKNSQKLLTMTTMLISIIICYLVPVLTFIPSFAGFAKFEFNFQIKRCNWNRLESDVVINIFFFVGFFIPLILMLFSYAKIFIVVHRSRSRVQHVHSLTGIRRSRVSDGDSRELKLTKMMATIFIAYLITYLPCTILVIGHLEFIVPRSLVLSSYIMLWSGSWINPVIYGLMNQRYRKAYISMLDCGYLKKNSNQSHPST